MGWAGLGACLPGHGEPQLTGHVDRCLMGGFFSLCAGQSMARATSSPLSMSRVADVLCRQVLVSDTKRALLWDTNVRVLVSVSKGSHASWNLSWCPSIVARKGLANTPTRA